MKYFINKKLNHLSWNMVYTNIYIRDIRDIRSKVVIDEWMDGWMDGGMNG